MNRSEKESRPRPRPRPWRVGADEHLQHCKVFDVHRTMMQSPTTGQEYPFYRIESPGWVNVVAVTTDSELVMVRQFRHGSRSLTLEIPGGLIDPGENPAEAGARELLEETGFRAGRMTSLGSISPNPALFANRCHMQVAQDCVAVGEIQNSATEETLVELLPLARLHETIRNGGIDHALVVAALYNFEIWRSGSD